MKITSETAELVGILIGDGHIYTNNNSYVIGFTGSPKTDREYYEYLQRLLLIAWKKEIKIKERARGLRITFNSKEICNYLIRELGVAHGKDKSENVKIPDLIANNWDLAKHTIRGICDTDGSIFVAKKPGVEFYPSIEITTSSYTLACQIKEILLNKGFNVANIWKYKSKLSKRMTYKVPLNGVKNVHKWVDEIGFSNPHKLSIAHKVLMG